MASQRVHIGALFDELAEDYEVLRLEVGWSPWEQLDAALGEGSLEGWRILDVGCGTGEVAEALIARGAEVVGVDASAQMCAQAAENVPGGTFIEATLGDGLPFRNGSFDAVIALGCMEYVADLHNACRDLVRITRSGGVVLYAIELCGHRFAGGDTRKVPLYDVWWRYRLPMSDVIADARELLEGADVRVVPAYHLEETGEDLMYGRVIGRAR